MNETKKTSELTVESLADSLRHFYMLSKKPPANLIYEAIRPIAEIENDPTRQMILYCTALQNVGRDLKPLIHAEMAKSQRLNSETETA